MILALAGGVGGARLAQGLALALPPERLCIAVNVGDDFEHLGLHVSPDIDTVMYTLARLHNTEQGWGLAGETWNFMDALARVGGETWFRLGDRDLAVHVERTRRVRACESLSKITADFCRRFNVLHAVIPATDQRLRTRVTTDEGELYFQDYFVRRRCEPAIRGLHYDGSHAAQPSPMLSELIDSGGVDGIVICPSNPWLSVAPILAIPALHRLVAGRDVPVVAVSPIIAGRAVKGPARKIMNELGAGKDTAGIVAHYGALVDGWVIDNKDLSLAAGIESAGYRVLATETLMSTPQHALALADAALSLLDLLKGR